MNTDIFTYLLSKYCNKSILSDLVLWKEYFKISYKKVWSKMYDVSKYKIWVCIDKIIDSVRPNVANIIVEILKAEFSGNKYLHRAFIKCSKRIAILKEKYLGLPNLPRLKTTSWSTWINALKYHCTHFNKLK